MNTTIERISILEREYVSEVLETQFATSKGAKFMQRLENTFSQRYENFNPISFTNGTATMHAALEAAGIGVGVRKFRPLPA
jgi:perosamine synthetase